MSVEKTPAREWAYTLGWKQSNNRVNDWMPSELYQVQEAEGLSGRGDDLQCSGQGTHRGLTLDWKVDRISIETDRWAE